MYLCMCVCIYFVFVCVRMCVCCMRRDNVNHWVNTGHPICVTEWWRAGVSAWRGRKCRVMMDEKRSIVLPAPVINDYESRLSERVVFTW